MELITERLTVRELGENEAARSIRRREGLSDDSPFLRKGLAAEKIDVNESERTVTAYVSTIAPDRDGEILLPRGAVLDEYRKNPVVQYAHDRFALPVGKNLWIKVDGRGLIAKTLFARHDFAEQVFQLYREGFLNAWSVGFAPVDWAPKDGQLLAGRALGLDESDLLGVRRVYTKWALLEYSAVPVPANPQALTIAIGKGLLRDERLRRDLGIAQEDRPRASGSGPRQEEASAGPRAGKSAKTAAPLAIAPQMLERIESRFRDALDRSLAKAIEGAIDEALARVQGRLD